MPKKTKRISFRRQKVGRKSKDNTIERNTKNNEKIVINNTRNRNLDNFGKSKSPLPTKPIPITKPLSTIEGKNDSVTNQKSNEGIARQKKIVDETAHDVANKTNVDDGIDLNNFKEVTENLNNSEVAVEKEKEKVLKSTTESAKEDMEVTKPTEQASKEDTEDEEDIKPNELPSKEDTEVIKPTEQAAKEDTEDEEDIKPNELPAKEDTEDSEVIKATEPDMKNLGKDVFRWNFSLVERFISHYNEKFKIPLEIYVPLN